MTSPRPTTNLMLRALSSAPPPESQAPVHEMAPVRKPARPDRRGKIALQALVTPDTHKALLYLGIERELTMAAMLGQAIEDYLIKTGALRHRG